MIDKTMTPPLVQSELESHVNNSEFGKEFAEATPECLMPDLDYSRLNSLGLKTSNIIAFLTIEESTLSNIVKNSKLLQASNEGGITISNNLESRYLSMVGSRCLQQGSEVDADFCSAMVGLCFDIGASLFECDAEGVATDTTFTPAQEGLVTEQGFAGTAFRLPAETNGS
mmetsp:Transcript_27619/g.34283  ORF Transcript_27619/g.34283 Transcript_27619/m.34283 type:complete len:170 (-) Transcript_27619:1228-1737(-)